MVENTDYGKDASAIERTVTGRRILFALFFWIVTRLLAVVLWFVVLFELCYALITKRLPPPRVVRLGHCLVRYEFDIGQFVSYNQEEMPFPFNDFAEETKPILN